MALSGKRPKIDSLNKGMLLAKRKSSGLYWKVTSKKRRICVLATDNANKRDEIHGTNILLMIKAWVIWYALRLSSATNVKCETACSATDRRVSVLMQWMWHVMLAFKSARFPIRLSKITFIRYSSCFTGIVMCKRVQSCTLLHIVRSTYWCLSTYWWLLLTVRYTLMLLKCGRTYGYAKKLYAACR